MKLSIVTINLNNVVGLKKTVTSIFLQIFLDFELIIIDGGSTDGSKEFIDSKINNGVTYFSSEKDKGVYDAMNKGIAVSKGEYLYFLNSGDVLFNENTLNEVVKKLTGEDFVYGNIIFNYKHQPELLKFQKNLSLIYFLQYTIHHQATFIKRNVFHKNGLFNAKNKIASDWSFFFENIIKNSSTYKHIDQVICIFDVSGLSSNSENHFLILEERMRYIAISFPEYFNHFCYLNEITYDKFRNKIAFLYFKFFSIVFRIKNKII